MYGSVSVEGTGDYIAALTLNRADTVWKDPPFFLAPFLPAASAMTSQFNQILHMVSTIPLTCINIHFLSHFL